MPVSIVAPVLLFVEQRNSTIYDPRVIADTVQSKDDEKIEALLKSETIWYLR